MPAEQHEGNLFFEEKKASPPGARALIGSLFKAARAAI
jgi:hypothetical protein